VLAQIVYVEEDEAGAIREDRRLAPVEPEVERHADDEDEVGLAEGGAASAWKEQRVARRQDSAGHAVDVQRQVRDLDQALQVLLCVRPPDAAARHHCGPLRFANETGGLLDGIGIG
jgi:hypothetical protein